MKADQAYQIATRDRVTIPPPLELFEAIEKEAEAGKLFLNVRKVLGRWLTDRELRWMQANGYWWHGPGPIIGWEKSMLDHMHPVE